MGEGLITSYVQRVRVSLTSVTMQVTDPVKWISERIEFFDQKTWERMVARYSGGPGIRGFTLYDYSMHITGGGGGGE